jgi:hypothetical protein
MSAARIDSATHKCGALPGSHYASGEAEAMSARPFLFANDVAQAYAASSAFSLYMDEHGESVGVLPAHKHAD